MSSPFGIHIAAQWECEVAAQKSADSYKRRQLRRDMLQSIKHGHEFGRNRVCSCGLDERDYALRADSLDGCSDLTEAEFREIVLVQLEKSNV